MRNFINARMNKDNFWNVMFFITLVGGVGIAFATNIMILSWFAIAGSIWIAKRNSSIFFDKEKSEFVINDNKRLKASGAEFIILMFASFGVMAIIGFILDGLKIDDSPLVLATMMSLLALLPIIYCIFRNLPIAVYFKKEAWSGGKSDSSYPSRNRNNSKPLLGLERMRTDPLNSWNSTNIYHRR
jgi:hypothetical protein